MSVPALAAKPGGGGGGAAPSVTEYSQCQNGGAPGDALDCASGWGNGILNTSNSHYAEDQVTPQRLLMSVPSGGGNHTLTIRYMTRKGNVNAHAYDSLATWNVTATQADPCQSLDAAICAGTPTTFPMASDSTSVPPVGAGIAAATNTHELPADSRKWTMYGGSVTATSTVTHTAASKLGTDDYAKVTITFHSASTGASNVLLLFGGHLARSGDKSVLRAWGTGLGSANINGGPYHIILDAIDGASVGSRDNQIMASAILSGSPNFAVTKTADRTTALPGDTVNYTITVTNTGTADGATSFTDDFDNRLDPTLPVSSPTGGTCAREPSGSTNKYFTCTTSLLSAGGGQQTFTYSAKMPATFSSGAGTGGCSTGQYPVINTVTLTTGGSQTVTVCVTASPSFVVSKSASPAVANPGQVVSYTITVTNNGSAAGSTTFTDDFDNRLTPMNINVGPLGGSCTLVTSGNRVLNCTTGTIPGGGGQQVITYDAQMPATFGGTAGGAHCSSTQFEIDNTVTLANGKSASAWVCVNASPTFTVKKTASKTTAGPGESITYTIVVTNGGTASGSTQFTDDFDDRLSPTLTVVPSDATCTFSTSGNKTLTCQTGTIAAGGAQTFQYVVTMPSVFNGTAGGSTCSSSNPQQYAVVNTVTLTNGAKDSATVCVNASPNFTVTKSALPSVALPGQQVTYTITVTNSGSASGATTFTDDFDDRLTPSTVTSSPSGGTCGVVNPTGSNKLLSCQTGTIAGGGQQQIFTYTANMPATYGGTPGGFGCLVRNPHQYPVRNVVVLANGNNSNFTVCVNASPDLHADKSAVTSTNANGDEILTYTITYTNTGPAEATSALVTESVPAGTSYVSCTGGCVTSGSPVSGVVWNVGPIAPVVGSGSVTMTVVVTATQQCQITNTAYIQFDQDPAVASNTVVVNIVPKPNPAGAHASGSGLGAQVLSSGIVGVNTAPISTASTSQSGPGGPKLANQSILSAEVPSGGAVLSTGVLNTTSTSVVTANPAQAHDTSTAEVAHVCVVPVAGLCTVEASTVRAVAGTTATGQYANWTTAGSEIQGLKVVGVTTPVDLSQTTTIPLNALVFGAGSYVAINERAGSTTQPAAGQTNGSYGADVSVTMIHVKITGLLTLQAAEVIVAKATSHSDFPQLYPCTTGTNQSLSGHAFIASASVGSLVPTIVQGGVNLAPLGGSEAQQIAGLGIPSDGSVVSAKAGDSHTAGQITATTSTAESDSEIAGDSDTPACVLRLSTGCVATATLIRSQANSTATSAGASSNATGTQFVGLSVLGAPIAGTPAANTTITLPGIGYLVLNEQFCDAGGAGANCTGAHHSGLTVRALHLVVNLPLPGLAPGAEVIVAEAHSDATFG